MTLLPSGVCSARTPRAVSDMATVTLYYVGDNAEDALTYEPYLTEREARDYANGTGGRMFSVQATVDRDTIKKLPWG